MVIGGVGISLNQLCTLSFEQPLFWQTEFSAPSPSVIITPLEQMLFSIAFVIMFAGAKLAILVRMFLLNVKIACNQHICSVLAISQNSL